MYDITLIITLGTTTFTRTCESASEAFDAWRDAWASLHKDVLTSEKQDEMMDYLLRMKKGSMFSTEHGKIRIIREERKPGEWKAGKVAKEGV